MIVWELNLQLFIASGRVKVCKLVAVCKLSRNPTKSCILPQGVAARKMVTLNAKVVKTNVIFLENRTHTAVYPCGSMHMEGGSQKKVNVLENRMQMVVYSHGSLQI